MFQELKVPHLQRLDPSGSVLASLDDGAVLRLMPTRFGVRWGAPIAISVNGLDGPVHELRWMVDSGSLALVTEHNVYMVPLGNSSASAMSTSAVPLLSSGLSSEPSRAAVRLIRDVRALDGGFMVRVRDSRYRETLLFVPVASASSATSGRGKKLVVGEPVSVLPANESFSAASVRSGGRIVLSTMTSEGMELRTYATAGRAKPELVETLSCPDNHCSPTNWTPRSRTLVYATSNGYRIERVVSRRGKRLVEFATPSGEDRAASILWANDDESRYLIGDLKGLWIADADGKVMWSWTPPDGRALTSARFAPDGTIIAAAGMNIYRVRSSGAQLLLAAKGKYDESKDVTPWRKSYSFVDEPLMLADNSIAYSVVNVKGAESAPRLQVQRK